MDLCFQSRSARHAPPSRSTLRQAQTIFVKTSLVVRLVLWIWFAAAVAAGHYGLFPHLPAPAIQGVLFGLTALLLGAYFGIASVRTWADAIPLRAFLPLHLTRFVGLYFLLLYRRGELPYAFAVPGGIGDIIVAVLAGALIFVPLPAPGFRRALTIWNVIGLVDILLVVLAAARLNLSAPSSMRALTYLPLSLLPAFLVPLIIASHVVIFFRLAAPAEKSS